MRLTYAALLVGVFALIGCGDDDAVADEGDGGSCSVGEEGCPCTGGGACDRGLTCASDLCVDLGGGPGPNAGEGGRDAAGTGGRDAAGTGGSGGANAGSGGTVAVSGDVASTLNASVILPDEGEPLIDPDLDPTVVIDPPLTPTQTQPLMTGSTVSVSLPFTAGSANVVAAGIRFGDSGPIRTVMLPDAQGQSAATLDFEFQVPASVCDDLANICHSIACYEFAVTSAGTISRANIQDLALLCGACTEPTCQDLLPAGLCTVECQTEADCEPGNACNSGLCVGEGALRFTLTWSSTTDLDLHVVTPTSIEIAYNNKTGDSGELDVDNQSGGTGAVENVFFTAPPAGSYTYFVRNYNGAAAGSFMLQVFKDGNVVATQSETLPAERSADSTRFTVSWP
jgi:hypothetical protein